jgi:hypothetical protein
VDEPRARSAGAGSQRRYLARTMTSETAGRVPDFFIVGHHKCGTTALYEMLRQHPQVFMPALKEPRFFAPDVLTEVPGANRGLPKTLEEYLALFDAAGADQRAGEATPLYLFSKVAAGRIAELQPRARIVALLREPASYLRSLHLQLLHDHTEGVTDLRRAIELEPARREGRDIPATCRRPQLLMYSERVRYVEQLRRYHEVFARDQVLVLIYEEFRRDNQATLRSVLRFLGVDEQVRLDATEANPTVRLRPGVEGFFNKVSTGRSPLVRSARGAVKAITPRRLRRDAFHAVRRRAVYGKASRADESLMLELRRRFEPEVVALSEYLDRDLVALWGYDSLS